MNKLFMFILLIVNFEVLKCADNHERAKYYETHAAQYLKAHLSHARSCLCQLTAAVKFYVYAAYIYNQFLKNGDNSARTKAIENYENAKANIVTCWELLDSEIKQKFAVLEKDLEPANS